jgi:predicted metal-dependent hydrolase
MPSTNQAPRLKKPDPKTTTHHITVDDLVVEVLRKNIKNLNLSVRPPDGKVRVSVPRRISDATVRQVVLERMEWIKSQQAWFASHAERATLHYVSGEKHVYLGHTYLLQVMDGARRPKVSLHGERLELHVPSGSNEALRAQALEAWYRAQIKLLIPPLIARWEPVIGVQVAEWGVKRMRTKWGTCSIRARRIWLNLELIKLPPEYLEYVAVHEMNHLLERLHTPRFKALLDQFMPGWRELRQGLEQAVKQNGRLRMG